MLVDDEIFGVDPIGEPLQFLAVDDIPDCAAGAVGRHLAVHLVP
ncbi:hypothetical protein [Microbacterium foliorum]|nr:hypothetical protein [Microbacterium foliorum]